MSKMKSRVNDIRSYRVPVDSLRHPNDMRGPREFGESVAYDMGRLFTGETQITKVGNNGYDWAFKVKDRGKEDYAVVVGKNGSVILAAPGRKIDIADAIGVGRSKLESYNWGIKVIRLS